MNNEQKNGAVQLGAVQAQERVEEYRNEQAQRVASMLRVQREYKVSKTTGLYIQILEKLEELTDNLIAVYEYEVNRDIQNHEYENLTESFAQARNYIEECLKERVIEMVNSRVITEI